MFTGPIGRERRRLLQFCTFFFFFWHKRKRSHSEREAVELLQPTQPTCLPEVVRDDNIPFSSVIDAEIVGDCHRARARCPGIGMTVRALLCSRSVASQWLCNCEQFVGAHSQSEGEAETFYSWERWTWKLHSHIGREWHLACRACWLRYCLSVSRRNNWWVVENSRSACGQEYEVPMYR